MPILVALLPSLIKAAEGLFPKKDGSQSTGSAKKEFVLKMAGAAWDGMNLGKIFHDFDRLDERKLFLDLVGVAVDHLVPVVVGEK